MTKKHVLMDMIPLFLVIFIDTVGLGLVFPILNAIFVDPHVSILPGSDSAHFRSILYGLVVGVFMLCWFFGAAIVSDLSDTIGRKKAMAICLLGAFLGYLLSGIGIYAHSITLLIIGRMIAGFTAGSQPVAQAAIVDIAPPSYKTRYIGYVLLAVSCGFIAGPVLGGILSDSTLVSWFNFTVPMYTAAILAFLNLILLQALYRETVMIRQSVKIKWSRAVTLFVDAFQNKTIRYLSISFFFYIIGWANYYSFVPMFAMHRYHITPTQSSLLMANLGIGFAIGMGYLVGKLTEHFKMTDIIKYSLFLATVLTLLVVFIHSQWLLWILTIPTAICVSVAYATFVSFYSDLVDETKQGWAMGVSGAVMALGFAITNFSTGLVAGMSVAIPMLLCAAGLLISALLIFKDPHQTK